MTAMGSNAKIRIEARTQCETLMAEAEDLGLSRDQRSRLQRGLTLERPPASRRNRQRADQIAAEVRRELLARLDETLKVETMAGGQVEPFNDAGAVRLSSRDGLWSLFKAGQIDAVQMAAGLAYRQAAEQAGAVKSQLGETTPGVKVDHVGLGLLRAKMAALATRIDITVAVELAHRPDALSTLRWVARDGGALRALAAGGRQQEHLLQGLCMALDVAIRFPLKSPLDEVTQIRRPNDIA